MIHFIGHYFWQEVALLALFLFFCLLGHLWNIRLALERLVALVEGEAEIAIQEQAKLN